MSDEPHPLDGKLEPEARDGCESITEAALLSLAVSIKRIADVMTSPVNSYGETMPEAIAGNIARALQEDRQWRR